MSGNVRCLDGGLFPEPERNNPPADERTAGQRRRDRQLSAIVRGLHPLSVALAAPIQLHPDARRDDQRTDDGSPRCGGCRFRERVHGGNHAYPKCVAHPHTYRRAPYRWETPEDDGKVTRTDYPRATHGAGTDVATWWPACASYEPTDR